MNACHPLPRHPFCLLSRQRRCSTCKMTVSPPAPLVRPLLTIEPGFVATRRTEPAQGITTLYQLLQASAKNNPQHIYAIQFSHNNKLQDAVQITHSDLLCAVDTCAEWLVTRQIAQRSRMRSDDPHQVQRGRPVAIFLGSDLNIMVYILALVKLGNPVSGSNFRTFAARSKESRKLARMLTLPR